MQNKVVDYLKELVRIFKSDQLLLFLSFDLRYQAINTQMCINTPPTQPVSEKNAKHAEAFLLCHCAF